MILKNLSAYAHPGVSTAANGRRSRFAHLLVVAAAGAAVMLTAPSASAFDSHSRLEGVWRVTRHGADCQTGQQLSTFMAITTFARGETLTGYGVPPGSSPALGSPEFGVWKHLDGPDYEFRILSYAYDASGAFAGSAEVAGNLELDHDADGFTYTSKITFLDAAGNRLFTVCGAGTGDRFGQK